MAREYQRGPRCRNSWRPSDGLLSLQTGIHQRQQLPVSPVPNLRSYTSQAPLSISQISSKYCQRLAPATTPATPQPPAQTFRNPNFIPVVSRRSQSFKTSRNLQQDGEPEEHLPQIWHPSIDSLITRTAHEYDLVMNYERDAEGGQRWLPEDIVKIRDVGKNLHRDVFALRRSQRDVAEQGDQDKNMMMQIKRDANFLKLLCERVQRAINRYEQKCEFELLRDGVYAQDEDGNFYKPTIPQHFMAKGGYLQHVPQSNTGYTEDDSLKRRYDHAPKSHQEFYRNHSKFRTPPDTRTSPSPKRNLASDFAFQTTPLPDFKDRFARQKSEAVRQSTSRRSDRVPDGRITRSYRDSPSARKRCTPSPAYRDRSASSNTHSAQSASGNKARNRERNNIHERDGRSRRQAKRDRSRERSSHPTAGRLGKHVLHY